MAEHSSIIILGLYFGRVLLLMNKNIIGNIITYAYLHLCDNIFITGIDRK